MGARPNFNVHIDSHHLCLLIGQGDTPASHTGCVIGPVITKPGISRLDACMTMGAFSNIVGAAVAVTLGGAPAAYLDGAFSTLTTPGASDSPWPGVKPADFWSALTSTQKAALAEAIVDAAIYSRPTA